MAEQAFPQRPVDQQAQQQTGQQVRLRIGRVQDDFRVRQLLPHQRHERRNHAGLWRQYDESPATQEQPEMLCQMSSRIVMNYYSAKRLALTLSQVIHRHEEQFGILEIDPAKRQKPGK